MLIKSIITPPHELMLRAKPSHGGCSWWAIETDFSASGSPTGEIVAVKRVNTRPKFAAFEIVFKQLELCCEQRVKWLITQIRFTQSHEAAISYSFTPVLSVTTTTNIYLRGGGVPSSVLAHAWHGLKQNKSSDWLFRNKNQRLCGPIPPQPCLKFSALCGL